MPVNRIRAAKLVNNAESTAAATFRAWILANRAMLVRLCANGAKRADIVRLYEQDAQQTCDRTSYYRVMASVLGNGVSATKGKQAAEPKLAPARRPAPATPPPVAQKATPASTPVIPATAPSGPASYASDLDAKKAVMFRMNDDD